MQFLAGHNQGMFGAPDRNNIPFLEEMDYVSSVSGGGYSSMGYLTALCFGKTHPAPGVSSVDHALHTLYDHALLHTPYAVPSFVANGLLVVVRSICYHFCLYIVVMYTGITQACAHRTLHLVCNPHILLVGTHIFSKPRYR